MVTNQQVRRLLSLMKSARTKAIAADKAGMDVKTARKYVKLNKFPSEIRANHDWQMRQNPFEADWEQIKELLKANPGLEAKTIFEYLHVPYQIPIVTIPKLRL